MPRSAPGWEVADRPVAIASSGLRLRTNRLRERGFGLSFLLGFAPGGGLAGGGVLRLALGYLLRLDGIDERLDRGALGGEPVRGVAEARESFGAARLHRDLGVAGVRRTHRAEVVEDGGEEVEQRLQVVEVLEDAGNVEGQLVHALGGLRADLFGQLPPDLRLARTEHATQEADAFLLDAASSVATSYSLVPKPR